VKRPWLQIAVVMVVLAAIHVGIGLTPMPPFSAGVNLALFFTNLFVFYTAATVLRRRQARAVMLFVVGYTGLFVLILAVMNKPPLFILLVIAYAGFFGAPGSAWFFAIFVLCFVILQPFAFRNLHSAVAHLFRLLARAREGLAFCAAVFVWRPAGADRGFVSAHSPEHAGFHANPVAHLHPGATWPVPSG